MRVLAVLLGLTALSHLSSVCAEDLGVGLATVSAGSEREKNESLRAGAKGAVEFIDTGGSLSRAPFSLLVEESAPDPQSRVHLLNALMMRGALPVVITGGEDDAQLARVTSQMHEVLLLSTSVLFDPATAGSFALHVGPTVSPVVERLISFLRERAVSRVWLVPGTEAWAAGVAEVVASELRGAGIDVRPIPGGGGEPTVVRKGDVVPKSSSVPFIVSIGHANSVLSGLVNQSNATQLPVVVMFGCDINAATRGKELYSGEAYSIDLRVGRERKEFRWLQKYISERYHPSMVTFDALVGFDAVMLIAEHLGRGSNTGRAIRQAIVGRGEFSGVSGRIRFSQDGSSRRDAVVNVITSEGCRELAG